MLQNKLWDTALLFLCGFKWTLGLLTHHVGDVAMETFQWLVETRTYKNPDRIHDSQVKVGPGAWDHHLCVSQTLFPFGEALREIWGLKVTEETTEGDAMQERRNRLALGVYCLCDAVNWETPTREGSSNPAYLLRDGGQLPTQREKSALSDGKRQKRRTICPLSKRDPRWEAQQNEIISRCVSRISRCELWNTYVWEITLMMPPQIVV